MEEWNPLISVIIPAYNEEKTICRTVNSLLQQTYSHFEILIVDDGSTDNMVAELIRQYDFTPLSRAYCHNGNSIFKSWLAVCNDIHIYLIEKANGGKSSALNLGINYCHGEFYACIDADCILPSNALSGMAWVLNEYGDIAAVGGQVLPKFNSLNAVIQGEFSVRNLMESYQELEYGMAFRIARPIFDILGTTMLISGAIGLFRKDVVLELGGYSSDTVGEDMELVMRIREYSAKNSLDLAIGYTQDALCFTEIPWKIGDWIKQRIRWAVGLTDVLREYRSVITDKTSSLLEKLTYCFYLLFEKFSPHIEAISIIICIVRKVSGFAIGMIVATILTQLLLAILGSIREIRRALSKADSALRAILRLLTVLFSFVTMYHLMHAIVRLIAAPYYRIKKFITRDKSTTWTSPTREGKFSK